jgi:hypothetical protein
MDATPSKSLKDKYNIYIRNLVGAKVISPTHDSVGRKIPKNLTLECVIAHAWAV